MHDKLWLIPFFPLLGSIINVALNIAPYETITTNYTSVTGEIVPATYWVLPENKAKGENLALVTAQNFDSIPGHGAKATVNGKHILVGNRKLMRDNNIGLGDLQQSADSLEGAGRTVVYAAIDGKLAGLIAIADAPRESSKATVAKLKSLGIQVAMLTGDNRATAERIDGDPSNVVGLSLPLLRRLLGRNGSM